MAKRKHENMDVDMEGAARADKCAIMVLRCEHCKCDLTNQRWAGWWKGKVWETSVIRAGMNITPGVPYSTMNQCMKQRCSSNSVEKSMFVIASTAVTLIYIHVCVGMCVGMCLGMCVLACVLACVCACVFVCVHVYMSICDMVSKICDVQQGQKGTNMDSSSIILMVLCYRIGLCLAALNL